MEIDEQSNLDSAFHQAVLPALPQRPARETLGHQSPAAAPRPALRALLDEFAACGLPLRGVTVTRLRVSLVLTDGRIVWCCSRWLLWLTGRPSCRGRPLYTLHSVDDAAGAARRLARSGAGDE
jgi:hypothetical protein